MTSRESLDGIVRPSRDASGTTDTWIKVTPGLEPRHRELWLCWLTTVERLLVAFEIMGVPSYFAPDIFVLFKPLIPSIHSNSRRRQS